MSETEYTQYWITKCTQTCWLDFIDIPRMPRLGKWGLEVPRNVFHCLRGITWLWLPNLRHHRALIKSLHFRDERKHMYSHPTSCHATCVLLCRSKRVKNKILCWKFLQSAILNRGVLAARAYSPDLKQWKTIRYIPESGEMGRKRNRLSACDCH